MLHLRHFSRRVVCCIMYGSRSVKYISPGICFYNSYDIFNVNKDVNTLRTTLFDMKVRNDDSDRSCSAYKEVHGNTCMCANCVMGGSDRQNHE